MARPSYGIGDERARDRIVSSFWHELQGKAYPDLRVVGLVREAGVNKNTFYYHFGCMEDVARVGVEGLLRPELLDALLGEGGEGPGAPLAARVDATWDERLATLLSPNAAALHMLLVERIGALWRERLAREGSRRSLGIARDGTPWNRRRHVWLWRSRQERGSDMGFLDSVQNSFNRAAASTGRATTTLQIRGRIEDALKRRQQLVAQLGASLYEVTRDSSELRAGREPLYDGIARRDAERTQCEAWIAQLEAEDAAAAPVPAPVAPAGAHVPAAPAAVPQPAAVQAPRSAADAPTDGSAQ